MHSLEPEVIFSLLIFLAPLLQREFLSAMKSYYALLLVFLSMGKPSWSAEALTSTSELVFATAQEGQKILTTRDDFVMRLSPFDRSARLKTDKPVDEEAYFEFVRQHVLEWSDDEKVKVLEATAKLRDALNELRIPLPPQVFMIKTTGREEGGAAYTRANAIVLPQANLQGNVDGLAKLICHELFHVLSRANPELRHRLYESIGFFQCEEPALPEELQNRKLTNPDAPINDHWIELSIDGQSTAMIPLLISRTEKYDVQAGGEFFNYLQFLFLAVQKQDNSPRVQVVLRDQKPALYPVSQLGGFFEKVGRNTNYIIHPEEILADNFVLLVTRSQDLKNPEIVTNMLEILTANDGN